MIVIHCYLEKENYKVLKCFLINPVFQDLKHFPENGKEKLFPNDFSFISNLKNAKANTILTI